MNIESRGMPRLLAALGLICSGMAPSAFAQDAQPPEAESAAGAPSTEAAGDAGSPVPIQASEATPSPARKPAANTDDEWPSTPLFEGAYITPLASYMKGRVDLGNAYGSGLAIGTRRGWYAIEMMGSYEKFSNDRAIHGPSWSASINGLLFPFMLLPNLYAIVGAGGRAFPGYQVDGADKHASAVTGLGGAGYLWRLNFSRYEMALRAEVLYRYGKRHQQVVPPGDYNAPGSFEDVVFNIGLQLPLRLKEAQPTPTPAPIKVVPPQEPVDADRDGVIDAQDQCPDTPVGVKVDGKGCILPPCKTPAPGQTPDFSGCSSGDSVVLRGVNFEFNRSVLTVNAQTILDDVATALVAQTTMHVEIGGHTDNKGTDSYNQQLSEARAQSVVAYLVGKGVAADRLSAVGYGESQPVADNNTDEGRELNRRVELKILGAVESQAAASEAAEAPTAAEAVTPEAASAEAAPAGESAAPVAAPQ